MYIKQDLMIQMKKEKEEHHSGEFEEESHDHEDFETGFYLICCEDFDDKISLQHTEDLNFSIDFSRRIEPGITKVFDLMYHKCHNGCQCKKGDSDNEIVMVGMDDDNFLIDKAQWNLVDHDSPIKKV